MPTRRQIKNGILNPTHSLQFLINKISSFPSKAYYEWHRIKNDIPKQNKLLFEFISSKSFGLIILDACRYDIFSEIVVDYIKGELQMVWGSGRWTGEYTVRTWNDFCDLVYFSSMPVVSDKHFERMGSYYRPSHQFDELVPLWDKDWDKSRGTVPADRVSDSVLRYVSQTDDPRFVAHYAQPHVPYIGDTEILPWDGESDRDIQIRIDMDDTPTTTFYHMVRENKISDEKLQKAYEDNLRYVLNEVVRLIRRVNCPVIITSDHGEHLGENGEYFHKNDSILLRKVPWFVVNDDEIGGVDIEEEYESSFKDNKTTATTDEIEERLAHLGYR